MPIKQLQSVSHRFCLMNSYYDESTHQATKLQTKSPKDSWVYTLLTPKPVQHITLGYIDR